MPDPFREGLSEFVTVWRRMATERASAKLIVAGVRRHLPLLPSIVPESWRTIAVVQELCVLVNDCLTDAPQRSVAIAKLATTIADNLDLSYPQVLRDSTAANAWFARGSALRACGAPFQALSAFDQGRHRVAFTLHFSDDAALIELGRGRTFVDLRRWKEARAAIVHARWLFASYDGVFESRVAECDELLRIIGASASRRRSVCRWAALGRRPRRD